MRFAPTLYTIQLEASLAANFPRETHQVFIGSADEFERLRIRDESILYKFLYETQAECDALRSRHHANGLLRRHGRRARIAQRRTGFASLAFSHCRTGRS